MSHDKPIPSYIDAITALVMFVKDIAKESQDPVLVDRATEVLGDFILAGLVKMAEGGRKPE